MIRLDSCTAHIRFLNFFIFYFLQDHIAQSLSSFQLVFSTVDDSDFCSIVLDFTNQVRQSKVFYFCFSYYASFWLIRKYRIEWRDKSSFNQFKKLARLTINGQPIKKIQQVYVPFKPYSFYIYQVYKKFINDLLYLYRIKVCVNDIYSSLILSG